MPRSRTAATIYRMNDTTRPQLLPIPLHQRSWDRAGLLDIARVLLLLQGGVLLATTLEALLFGIAFTGMPGTPFLLSGASALAVLVGRARLRPDRNARVVYAVEGVVLVTFAIDAALAFFITHGAPPAVAILTRFVLPVAIIGLLRRSTFAAGAHAPITTEGGA